LRASWRKSSHIMAAILRSGKFLRLFSGVARNLAAGPNKTDDQGVVPQQLLFDKNFSTSTTVQNVLPYIGVSDSGHAEDRFPTRLMDTPNRLVSRVSRDEIELMAEEIEATEVSHNTAQLLASQALLAIRLCGSVLDQEQPSTRSALVSKIWGLLETKAVPTTVNHYNALLRVHLENGHQFAPEEVLADMSKAGVKPDKETFQCLISRHCQVGDVEGAGKVLQMMKTEGIKVNENIFNSLIMGHGESGDLARAHGMLKVMKTWGLVPSAETFLTLACAYAKAGDWQGVERVVGEAAAQGTSFKDGDYLELIFALSEGGHKEHINKVLALSHPESDNFGSLVSHLVVRLINMGHDDVGYNLVKYTVDNSCDSTGRLVCDEFLSQLVYVNRPAAKLLWFVKDMGEQKILSGGLNRLVEVAVSQKNLPLGIKLAEILLGEGGKLKEEHFTVLLSLAAKSKDEDAIFSCVRLGTAADLITPDQLKKDIFPSLESWPELVVASLEECGLGREVSTTPMVEWLVGKGRTEAAATVAGIFQEHLDPKLKFLTSAARSVGAVCNHFNEPQPLPQQSTSPQQQLQQTEPANPEVNELNEAGLERLLEPSVPVEQRAAAYMRLLEIFAANGSMEQAVQLSKRLKADETLHLPQFYDLLGAMAESQYAAPQYYPQQGHHYPPIAYQFSPQHGTFIPMPVVHAMDDYYSPGAVFHQQQMLAYPPQYSPAPSTAPAEPSTGHSSVAPSPPPECSRPELREEQLQVEEQDRRASFPDTCYTEGYEYSYEASVLHRQLKRAIMSGAAGEGLAAYRAMERLGRPVNVTETSSLVEQLIRADMTVEASEVTRGMLARDTHPLPKIFRFLLNKLATLGSVEEILSIGQYLPTKIKKDVSFDNRLCNAYLSAGRGSEFLEVLVQDLAIAARSGDSEQLAAVKDRFPRGGAMGLLDSHPELLDRYTLLAQQFAAIDYVAPMNVLWTYHFIHGNSDVAEPIWQNFVKGSNQIMFQKVCQVARATGDIEMAFSLVNHLGEAAQVTSGARGIAYSCLLDCLCAGNQHRKGWEALQEALGANVALEDINRTALVRLKQGLEESGESFPYQVPPKNSKKDSENRSLSPVDWTEM